MLKVTKLNDSKILIALETIKYIEQQGDTIIYFINGENIVIKESLQQIYNQSLQTGKSEENDKTH